MMKISNAFLYVDNMILRSSVTRQYVFDSVRKYLSRFFFSCISLFLILFIVGFQSESFAQRKKIQPKVDDAFIIIAESPGFWEVPAGLLKPAFVSVIGVGDIMMGTDYPNASFLPINHGRHILKPLHGLFQSATLTFGNLEGVLMDGGDEYAKHCNNPAVCFTFRMPERYIGNLVDAGFDMVSLANNHVMDFGAEGSRRTIATLDEAGMAFAGVLGYPKTIVERDGIKFGMAAFAPNRGTVSMYDIPAAQGIIRELKEESDIVIVSFHGGAEGASHQNVKCETEYFLGHNRGNVCEFAKAMIDAGADIVFGHGPHVTRAVDIYKDRFIAYSLGNFWTYARFNIRGENGIAPIIKVYTDTNGKFLQAEVTPVRLINRGEPVHDEQNRAIRSLQRLGREDFPNSELMITDDGIIKRK